MIQILSLKNTERKKKLKKTLLLFQQWNFPILKYEKFYGETYTIKPEDQVLTIKLQRKLRKLGKPKSVPDLLIAAICINRNEELLTKDEDFLDISKISELKVNLAK